MISLGIRNQTALDLYSIPEESLNPTWSEKPFFFLDILVLHSSCQGLLWEAV